MAFDVGAGENDATVFAGWEVTGPVLSGLIASVRSVRATSGVVKVLAGRRGAGRHDAGNEACQLRGISPTD
ncbi:hypothetical protein [Consotaella salsifontis]|uniref:hypothetical protein n=1 Tax=Consotaella salsifontis TaxID=1365950 RepID=UPI00099AB857|nr:hypothetical protein [Consotaella salsifontis]